MTKFRLTFQSNVSTVKTITRYLIVVWYNESPFAMALSAIPAANRMLAIADC